MVHLPTNCGDHKGAAMSVLNGVFTLTVTDTETGKRGTERNGSWYLSLCIVTAPDRCFYLSQASLTIYIAGLKRGKTNRSPTATDAVMAIT